MPALPCHSPSETRALDLSQHMTNEDVAREAEEPGPATLRDDIGGVPDRTAQGRPIAFEGKQIGRRCCSHRSLTIRLASISADRNKIPIEIRKTAYVHVDGIQRPNTHETESACELIKTRTRTGLLCSFQSASLPLPGSLTGGSSGRLSSLTSPWPSHSSRIVSRAASPALLCFIDELVTSAGEPVQPKEPRASK